MNLLNHVIKNVSKYGIKVTVYNHGLVSYKNPKVPDIIEQVDGYFDSETKELVYTRDNDDNGIWTLLHEYCHFEQWIENHDWWDATNDAADIMDEYLTYTTPILYSAFQKAVKAIKNIELDCERRALKKIDELKLDIDKKEYSKSAAAYIHFHNYLIYTDSCWFDDDQPWYNKEIMELMPDNLDGSFEPFGENQHIFNEYRKQYRYLHEKALLRIESTSQWKHALNEYSRAKS